MLVSSFGQKWRSQSQFSNTAINTFVGICLFAGSTFNACANDPVDVIGGTNVTTANCPTPTSEHLSATYTIATNQGEQQSLTLLRNADQIIYQRNDVSFELWNKQGEYVRYFPNQQRSISYRKGDLLSLNMHFDYQQLSQIIVPSTMPLLTAVNSVQQAEQKRLPAIPGTLNLACQPISHYQVEQHNQQLKLAWLSELALPANISIMQGAQQVTYHLVELNPLTSAEFSQHIANYRDMDFADVGDNESDPFIAKMIHQGFIEHGSSGFYDSQGNPLSSDGSGHQH